MRPQATSLTQLSKTPAKMEDDLTKVKDSLLEVNLGIVEDLRTTFSRVLLNKGLIELLTFCKDCFAWDYHKLPRLDKELVEHCLPIKPNFRPYQ